jgi:hypothetical protein
VCPDGEKVMPHADKFFFEVSLFGPRWIVDAGCFTCTNEEKLRHQCASAPHHMVSSAAMTARRRRAASTSHVQRGRRRSRQLATMGAPSSKRARAIGARPPQTTSATTQHYNQQHCVPASGCRRWRCLVHSQLGIKGEFLSLLKSRRAGPTSPSLRRRRIDGESQYLISN